MNTLKSMPPSFNAHDSRSWPSEVHTFLFDGKPVRGMLVRLDDAWAEVLKRRAGSEGGPYPEAVCAVLGELTAAAVLMQANLKFNGALVLQISGDGPLKLAVAEVQADLKLRATAKVIGDLPEAPNLATMVNVQGKGLCAITLDPQDRLPGQQPYQGVVPLVDEHGQNLLAVNEALEHYMRQSEQLDTRIVLAANGQRAAGLLIQRMPGEGARNIGTTERESSLGSSEDFNRIAMLTGTLTAQELLTLDVDAILHRLYWEEPHTRFVPRAPSFSCRCSRDKVANMLKTLGPQEVESILAEQGQASIHCEFCGASYTFDAVDAAGLFLSTSLAPTGSSQLQ